MEGREEEREEEGWLGGREGRREGEGDERMDDRAIERNRGASSKRWTTSCPSSHFSQKPCQISRTASFPIKLLFVVLT